MTTEATDTICQSALGSAMILPQILKYIQSVYKQLMLLKQKILDKLSYSIVLFILKSDIKLWVVIVYLIIINNIAQNLIIYTLKNGLQKI